MTGFVLFKIGNLMMLKANGEERIESMTLFLAKKNIVEKWPENIQLTALTPPVSAYTPPRGGCKEQGDAQKYSIPKRFGWRQLLQLELVAADGSISV